MLSVTPNGLKACRTLGLCTKKNFHSVACRGSRAVEVLS